MTRFADQCALERRAKPQILFVSEVLGVTEEAHHQLADRQLVGVEVFEGGGQRPRQKSSSSRAPMATR